MEQKGREREKVSSEAEWGKKQKVEGESAGRHFRKLP
jgi:hypothetical protein